MAGSILEIIGVSYKGNKQFVIGCKKALDDEELFVTLSVDEVKKIEEWIKEAETKIQEYKSSKNFSETKVYQVDFRISPRIYLGIWMPDLANTPVLNFYVDNYRVHKIVLLAFKDVLSSFLNEF